MLLTPQQLSKAPDWQQQLNLDNPQQLVGPDEYSPDLKKLLQGRTLRNWLLKNGGSSSAGTIVKTPAGCILTPVSMLGSQPPQRMITVPTHAEMQRIQARQQQGQSSAVDLARLQLGELCRAIQEALQLPADTAMRDADFRQQLGRMQAAVPKILSTAFASFCDLISFQHTFLLPEMETSLFCSIMTMQALRKKIHVTTRLELIQQHHLESMAAVQEAAATATAAQVAECWDRLLRELQVTIFDPINMWQSSRQQLRQQVQQSEGLCAAIRDAAVMQCYIVARKCSSGSQRVRGMALRAAAGSIGASAFILQNVADCVIKDPKGLMDALYHRLVPGIEQLKELATALHSVAQQLPAGAASSVHELLHKHGLLVQCAAKLQLQQLSIQGSGLLSPADILGLWVGAIPAGATIQQIYDTLSVAEAGSSNSSSRNLGSSEPVMEVGSEAHLRLVARFLKEVSQCILL